MQKMITLDGPQQEATSEMRSEYESSPQTIYGERIRSHPVLNRLIDRYYPLIRNEAIDLYIKMERNLALRLDLVVSKQITNLKDLAERSMGGQAETFLAEIQEAESQSESIIIRQGKELFTTGATDLNFSEIWKEYPPFVKEEQGTSSKPQRSNWADDISEQSREEREQREAQNPQPRQEPQPEQLPQPQAQEEESDMEMDQGNPQQQPEEGEIMDMDTQAQPYETQPTPPQTARQQEELEQELDVQEKRFNERLTFQTTGVSEGPQKTPQGTSQARGQVQQQIQPQVSYAVVARQNQFTMSEQIQRHLDMRKEGITVLPKGKKANPKGQTSKQAIAAEEANKAIYGNKTHEEIVEEFYTPTQKLWEKRRVQVYQLMNNSLQACMEREQSMYAVFQTTPEQRFAIAASLQSWFNTPNDKLTGSYISSYGTAFGLLARFQPDYVQIMGQLPGTTTYHRAGTDYQSIWTTPSKDSFPNVREIYRELFPEKKEVVLPQPAQKPKANEWTRQGGYAPASYWLWQQDTANTVQGPVVTNREVQFVYGLLQNTCYYVRHAKLTVVHKYFTRTKTLGNQEFSMITRCFQHAATMTRVAQTQMSAKGQNSRVLGLRNPDAAVVQQRQEQRGNEEIRQTYLAALIESETLKKENPDTPEDEFDVTEECPTEWQGMTLAQIQAQGQAPSQTAQGQTVSEGEILTLAEALKLVELDQAERLEIAQTNIDPHSSLTQCLQMVFDIVDMYVTEYVKEKNPAEMYKRPMGDWQVQILEDLRAFPIMKSYKQNNTGQALHLYNTRLLKAVEGGQQNFASMKSSLYIAAMAFAEAVWWYSVDKSINPFAFETTPTTALAPRDVFDQMYKPEQRFSAEEVKHILKELIIAQIRSRKTSRLLFPKQGKQEQVVETMPQKTDKFQPDISKKMSMDRKVKFEYNLQLCTMNPREPFPVYGGQYRHQSEYQTTLNNKVVKEIHSSFDILHRNSNNPALANYAVKNAAEDKSIGFASKADCFFSHKLSKNSLAKNYNFSENVVRFLRNRASDYIQMKSTYSINEYVVDPHAISRHGYVQVNPDQCLIHDYEAAAHLRSYQQWKNQKTIPTRVVYNQLKRRIAEQKSSQLILQLHCDSSYESYKMPIINEWDVYNFLLTDKSGRRVHEEYDVSLSREVPRVVQMRSLKDGSFQFYYVLYFPTTESCQALFENLWHHFFHTPLRHHSWEILIRESNLYNRPQVINELPPKLYEATIQYSTQFSRIPVFAMNHCRTDPAMYFATTTMVLGYLGSLTVGEHRYGLPTRDVVRKPRFLLYDRNCKVRSDHLMYDHWSNALYDPWVAQGPREALKEIAGNALGDPSSPMVIQTGLGFTYQQAQLHEFFLSYGYGVLDIEHQDYYDQLADKEVEFSRQVTRVQRQDVDSIKAQRLIAMWSYVQHSPTLLQIYEATKGSSLDQVLTSLPLPPPLLASIYYEVIFSVGDPQVPKEVQVSPQIKQRRINQDIPFAGTYTTVSTKTSVGNPSQYYSLLIDNQTVVSAMLGSTELLKADAFQPLCGRYLERCVNSWEGAASLGYTLHQSKPHYDYHTYSIVDMAFDIDEDNLPRDLQTPIQRLCAKALPPKTQRYGAKEQQKPGETGKSPRPNVHKRQSPDGETPYTRELNRSKSKAAKKKVRDAVKSEAARGRQRDEQGRFYQGSASGLQQPGGLG